MSCPESPVQDHAMTAFDDLDGFFKQIALYAFCVLVMLFPRIESKHREHDLVHGEQDCVVFAAQIFRIGAFAAADLAA